MGEQPLPSGCRQELGTSAPGLYPALHYPIAIRETAGSMEKIVRLGVCIDPNAARISNPV